VMAKSADGFARDNCAFDMDVSVEFVRFAARRSNAGRCAVVSLELCTNSLTFCVAFFKGHIGRFFSTSAN
jgi:hypothetical protein